MFNNNFYPMKHTIATIAIACIAVTAHAQYDTNTPHNNYQQGYTPPQQQVYQQPQQQQQMIGRVISVQPRMQQVATPVTECQQVGNQPQSGGYAAPIIGGVVGAILGNQVGNGKGRIAATAIGTGIGAAVGERQFNQPQQQCAQTTRYDNVIAGYTVTYEFGNQQFVQNMQYDPGKTVRLTLIAQ